MSAPSRPEPTKVVTVTQVGDGGVIYEIQYDSGGATVPIIYRYFLMEHQRSVEDALENSKKIAPFLVTKSAEAVRGISDGIVKLKTDSTVYEFHNPAYFPVDGELNQVLLELDSTLH
ncbi:hypothetical protein D3C75_1152390 [compost metagenome]